MSKYTILATNDDGVESPLFLRFIEHLARADYCEELRFVVPSEEQSWIAQAASVKRPIFTSEYNHSNCKGFIASGTPADCASLGVHNLFANTPDFLISGINIGSNAGLGFYLSSGTVAAARQGFLHGIPSIAFSVRVPRELFAAWGSHDLHELAKHQAGWDRVIEHCVDIGATLLANFAQEKVDLFSVNLPWELTPSSKRILTSLKPVSYPALFRQRAPGEYLHHLESLLESDSLVQGPDDLEYDRDVVERGDVSISPIRYRLDPSKDEYLEKLKKLL